MATNESLLGLCRLLIAAGQWSVALELLPRLQPDLLAPDIPSSLDGLTALGAEAGPARSWGDDDVVRAARYWLGARRMLIGGDPRHLRLLPMFPTAWMGGNVEVHDAPTTHGRVSFAIRWHGARPALLWDLTAEKSIEIRCPGLDPDWTTTERSGDALLAGTAAGLGPVPAEGQSFG